MKRTKVIIASIMIAGMSQSAHAVGVEAIGLLNQYSIVTAGDLTSSSWSARGALVGGNVTGGQYSIKNPNTAALTVAGNAAGNIAAQGNGVTVAGNVSGTFNLHNSGDANIGSVTGTLQNNANGKGSTYIVGDVSGRVTTNGGNTTYGGDLIGQGKAIANSGSVIRQNVSLPVDAGALASNAVTTLSEFSQQLAGLTSNSGYTIEGGKVTFNAVTDDSGLAIFNITNAQSFFNTATAFDFKLDGAKSVLFNVFGEASDILNIGATFWGGMPANRGSEFLWNFVGSEILNFNSQFGGTVLAMGADVTSRGAIEGSIASNSLSQYSYVTSQSLSNVFAPPAAVPVPAAMPLFLSGLLGFAAIRRYGRKKANQDLAAA